MKTTPFEALRRFVPTELRMRLHWWRSLRSVERFSISDLQQAFDAIRQEIDIDEIQGLSTRMMDIRAKDPVCAAKYVDYQYWLKLNIVRAAKLGLHRKPGRRILDIGCGPGYWGAVCRHYGHVVTELDVPDALLTGVEREVYSTILEALHGDRKVAQVCPFVPLPVSGDYDLIVGFLVCFNGHGGAVEWSSSEWKYFIEDCVGHLSKRGVLRLELNANPARYQGLVWYDRETRDYLTSVGTVEDNVIVVPK